MDVSALTTEKVLEIAGQVMRKATTDSEFRALALSDGSKAVEQVTGLDIPDGFKIRFVENNDAAVTLGLPPLRTSGELSDRDLEKVAGGREEPDPGAIVVDFFNGVLS